MGTDFTQSVLEFIMTRGVVYIASGQEYVRQAVRSAKSVRAYNDLDITIFTNTDVTNDVFDEIISIGKNLNTKADSILNQNHIVYDKNLYLDVDTLVCDDISELFQLLEFNSVGAARNSDDGAWNADVYDDVDINFPHALPEYNTGVIVYDNSKIVKRLFNEWNKTFERNTSLYNLTESNQPAFRLALYKVNHTPVTISPRFNYQMSMPTSVSGKVKIFHDNAGIVTNIQRLAQKGNSTKDRRFLLRHKYPCKIVRVGDKKFRYRYVRNLFDKITRKYLMSKLTDKKYIVDTIKNITGTSRTE